MCIFVFPTSFRKPYQSEVTEHKYFKLLLKESTLYNNKYSVYKTELIKQGCGCIASYFNDYINLYSTQDPIPHYTTASHVIVCVELQAHSCSLTEPCGRNDLRRDGLRIPEIVRVGQDTFVYDNHIPTHLYYTYISFFLIFHICHYFKKFLCCEDLLPMNVIFLFFL